MNLRMMVDFEKLALSRWIFSADRGKEGSNTFLIVGVAIVGRPKAKLCRENDNCYKVTVAHLNHSKATKPERTWGPIILDRKSGGKD